MEKEILNGFEVFDDFMSGNEYKRVEKTEVLEDIEGAVEELTDKELEALKTKGTPTKKEKPVEQVEEEEDIIEEPVKPTKKNTTKKTEEEVEEAEEEDDDPIQEDNNEELIITGFFDSLSEKLGWDEVEDDEKPKTAEDLIEYFKDVIEENSKPSYSSKEVEELDNFVRNGGNIRDYFSIDADIDVDNISIEDDENNQKLIIREFLKEKGFNQKQIEKKLSKYEDAGLLEDEAEDALEALRDIYKEKKQLLLENQEKAVREALKRQQDYFNTVVNEMKSLNDIYGVKIPEKDKKELLEYIFKPDSTGMTKYRKDMSNGVKNLIMSAYFTMKGETLMNGAKIKGSNTAIDKFKNNINKTGISRRTKKLDNTSESTMWDSFVNRIRVK